MLFINLPILLKFPLGQLVCTKRISTKMEQDEKFKKFVELSLNKYASGNWGDTCNEDAKLNDIAMRNGYRIVAVYRQEETNIVIWIITESDRSITTILFPDEY